MVEVNFENYLGSAVSLLMEVNSKNKKNIGHLDTAKGNSLFTFYDSDANDVAKELHQDKDIQDLLDIVDKYRLVSNKSNDRLYGTLQMVQSYQNGVDKNTITRFDDKMMYLINKYVIAYLKTQHFTRQSIHNSHQIILTNKGYRLYKHPHMYLDKFFSMYHFSYQPLVPLQDVLYPIVTYLRFIMNHKSYIKYAGLVFIEHIIDFKTYQNLNTYVCDNTGDTNTKTPYPITYLMIILSLIDTFFSYLDNPYSTNSASLTPDCFRLLDKLIDLDITCDNHVYISPKKASKNQATSNHKITHTNRTSVRKAKSRNKKSKKRLN